MARILAISSQVARGSIGLSAIVPALQALGHEVVALPTILLSNHPGHPHFAGERLSPDLLTRMLDALEANAWLSGIDAVLTGYLPSVEHVAMARQAVDRLRRLSPGVLYLCDPVMGDWPKGLYIAQAAAAVIRDQLVPVADILKMNCFECGWITGEAIAASSEARRIVLAQGWREALVTSLPVPGGQHLDNLLVVRDEPCERTLQVAIAAHVPNGTGDLMAALYLGHRMLGPSSLAQAFASAVAGVEAVVANSIGHDELQLVASLAGLRGELR